MVKCTYWIILYLAVFAKSTKAVITNEHIRDAIISVVHMIRATDDKLARHETRERALGETLKKALSTIEKRQRLMEPVKGTLGRLDERLATVETILMQKDERERIQSQKVFDGVEKIQKDFPALIEKIKNDIIEEISRSHATTFQPITTPSVNILKVQEDLNEKLDKLTKSIDSIEKKLEKMEEDNKKLKEVNKSTSEKLQDIDKKLGNSEQLLVKYDNRLSEFSNMIEVIPSNVKDSNEWHTSFLKALEVQKTNIEQILSDVKTVANKIQNLPVAYDLETSKNETLELLEQVKYETIRSADKTATIIDAKFSDFKLDSDKKHESIEKAIVEVSEMAENLNANVANSYEELKGEVQALGKVEQVMVQTADGVLDTKRRVEYGVHQILLEVGDVIKSSSKEITSFINDKFDDFELSILDEENGALANLTSKIGQEIDQVWRQIGIMHQQMTASTDTLNKLQNQTDIYVNGSLNSMDSMKGKVSTITDRMAEVDDNLNYLLGRLSLVTQEFNQIKTGLGQALDEIKSSFMTVQEKIRKAGPGPHKIPEYEIQSLEDTERASNKTSKRSSN